MILLWGKVCVQPVFTNYLCNCGHVDKFCLTVLDLESLVQSNKQTKKKKKIQRLIFS